MNQDTHTSSPGRLVALGAVVGTHGIRGLLRFHSYGPASSGVPVGQPVYLTARPAPGDDIDPAGARPIFLDAARPHGNIVLLSVRGIDSIEAATPLVGHALAIPEDDLPAPAPGEFYVYRLAGLHVVTNAGEDLGTIDRSFSTGASEVLVVRDGAREHLIPMIADIVQTIDLAGGRVIISPIPGLLDTQEPARARAAREPHESGNRNGSDDRGGAMRRMRSGHRKPHKEDASTPLATPESLGAAGHTTRTGS